MELINYPKATFLKSALVIDEDISLDEWKQIGKSLMRVDTSIQFWIGDWARFGEKKGFTEKYTDGKVYDELVEITGLARQTIQQYKYIAAALDSNLRRPDLSFSHHREITGISDERREAYLDLASKEKLTVDELRRVIRGKPISRTGRSPQIELPEECYTSDLTVFFNCREDWEYFGELIGEKLTPKQRIVSFSPELANRAKNQKK